MGVVGSKVVCEGTVWYSSIQDNELHLSCVSQRRIMCVSNGQENLLYTSVAAKLEIF